MVENIKCMIYVCILAVPGFYIGRLVSVPIIGNKQFLLWRSCWFMSTIAAFLSGSFFVFIFALALICWYGHSRSSKPALYVVLLFTAPLVQVSVGGLGIVNELLLLDHAQVLAVLLLIPALYSASKATGPRMHEAPSLPRLNQQRSSAGAVPQTRTGHVCDGMIVAYLILTTVLSARDGSATHVLRMAVIQVLSIALPYFAFSRAVRTVHDVRVILAAFVVSALPMAAVGIFEIMRSWLLYPTIPGSWGISLLTPYILRENMLRAQASTGGPLVFGFILMVAMGCLLAIRGRLPAGRGVWLAFGLLAAGLASSLSRGPWLGAIILVLIAVASSSRRLENICKLVGLSVCMLPLLFTPVGERVVQMMPFIGTVEPESVHYRDKLIHNAIEVIFRNPLAGVVDYSSAPEMQEMIQGQGIIDVTNTYLQIALTFGLIGLGVFLTFFAGILVRLGLSLNAVSASELNLPALFAILAAILFTIVTVSSISFIPYIYWMFAGLSIGVLRSIETQRALHRGDGMSWGAAAHPAKRWSNEHAAAHRVPLPAGPDLARPGASLPRAME